jgi:hypothetical protein
MYKGMKALLAVMVLGYGGATMGEGNGDQHGSGQLGGAGQHGNQGGMTARHMSGEGRENTNAQWSGGATKGQDRSDLRSGDHQGHGKNHGQNHGKSKGRGQDHGKHQ